MTDTPTRSAVLAMATELADGLMGLAASHPYFATHYQRATALRLALTELERAAAKPGRAPRDAERITHVEAFPNQVTWCPGLLGAAGAWVGDDPANRRFATFPNWREAVDASLASLRAWAARDPERFKNYPHLFASSAETSSEGSV